jgi:hypothetical protein
VSEHHWGNDGTVICPDSVRVLLRYTEIINPTTAAGGLYWYVYRGNSCFDPNFTGTGAQPNGFDQWAFFYNSYVVLSSRIRLEIIGNTNSATYAVAPLYSSSSPASASDVSGMRYAVSKSGILVGNATLIDLTDSMSTAQQFGISEAAVVEDDLYSALVTANVATAQSWFWGIAVQDDLGSSTLNGSIRVLLEYDVKFFDVTQFSLSAHRPDLATSGGGAAAAALPAAANPCCRYDGCQTVMKGAPPGG